MSDHLCYELSPEDLISCVQGPEAVKKELLRRINMIDQLLDHCGQGECEECAMIICPFCDPMHLHHDGCPACAEFDPASTI